MTVKKKKNKIHKYLSLVILFLSITAILVVTIFAINIGSLLGSNGETVVYQNDFYKLTGNPTAYQRDLFKQLSSELKKDPQDDFAVVSLVVQSFVSDYFTWSNKLGTYDVGGKTFVFATEFTNFNATARRYLYEPMSVFHSNGVEQIDMPEVEQVTINNINYAYDYSYQGTPYTSYYVEASWTYKANEKVDTSIFQNWGAFTIIKTKEGRYEIARFY